MKKSFGSYFFMILLVYPQLSFAGIYTGSLKRSGISEFKPSITRESQYHIGRVENIPSGFKEQSFNVFFKLAKDDNFTIYFSFNDKTPRHPQAYVLGKFSKDNEIKFVGAWIRPSLRGKGLFKYFMKFFFAFTSDLNGTFRTGIMKKPTVSLVLSQLGLIPENSDNLALIENLHPKDSKLGLYPVGFEVEDRLIKSQNLKILDQPPIIDSYAVCLNTRYSLPLDDRIEEYETIGNLPGIPVLSEPRPL